MDASKKYEVTLNFYHSVDPEKVTSKNIGRCLEFTIPKKESGPYWPTLTTDKTKLHFLKANFAKWRDESDDEEGRIQKCLIYAFYMLIDFDIVSIKEMPRTTACLEIS